MYLRYLTVTIWDIRIILFDFSSFLTLFGSRFFALIMSSKKAYVRFFITISLSLLPIFKIMLLITRLIEIDTVPSTVLFCNARLLICNCLPLKDINFNAKCVLVCVWLTSNHMFVSGNFGNKSPSWFLKNLKLPSFYLDIFKNFEKCTRTIYLKSPSQACDY